MIDTIYLTLERNKLPKNYLKFLQEIASFENYGYNKNNQEKLEFWYSGLYIKLTSRNLRISGSLTKYAIGNTLMMASKQELFVAMVKLSNKLKINLFDAIVTRIDFAANIITKEPVTRYHSIMNNVKRIRRLEQPTALVYWSTSRQLQLYDKMAELGKKNTVKFLHKKHVLRYEVKYLNQQVICDFLKVENVNLLTIFANYSNFVNGWVNAYNSIDKKNEPTFFSDEVFANKKLLTRQLIRAGIESNGGLIKMDESIECSKKKGLYDKYPNQPSNIKAWMRKVMNDPKLVSISNLNAELISKIRMLAFYAVH